MYVHTESHTIWLQRDLTRSSSLTTCSEASNRKHYSIIFASVFFLSIIFASCCIKYSANLAYISTFLRFQSTYVSEAMSWLCSAARLTFWLTFPPLTLSCTCSSNSSFKTNLKHTEYITSKIIQISNNTDQIRRNSVSGFVRICWCRTALLQKQVFWKCVLMNFIQRYWIQLNEKAKLERILDRDWTNALILTKSST